MTDWAPITMITACFPTETKTLDLCSCQDESLMEWWLLHTGHVAQGLRKLYFHTVKPAFNGYNNIYMKGKRYCFRPPLCRLFGLNWARQGIGGYSHALLNSWRTIKKWSYLGGVCPFIGEGHFHVKLFVEIVQKCHFRLSLGVPYWQGPVTADKAGSPELRRK